MSNVIATSLFTDFDINLFKQGKHYRLYEKLGSHVMTLEEVVGTYFAVWAPNAKQVSVIGDFNEWDKKSHLLHVRLDGSGIWEGFIPDTGHGTVYKYAIHSNLGDQQLEKGDPFALQWETPPKTASVVGHTYYDWEDEKWMANRKALAGQPKPWSVYELHLGSWKKKPKTHEGDDGFYTYLELIEELVPYVKEMGFTHVELMPVMEHPFYGSWGYQITGYFAPTSRFGTPQEFMQLIDAFHQADIGVISDWVPSHFPNDKHGLYEFDGTHLFEHADPRKGYHPDWKSAIFNYGRYEVRSFLISNALFWLDRYHIDGLRVDAVASMLYLDYSREEGQWIPNKFGGNENLEAISLLKELNEVVYKTYPDVETIAEESTAWPGVSHPTDTGGLGFGQKWMMGWMHDTLNYFKRDTIYRRFHQNDLTFSTVYAFDENFMLPLSHDEVVHGKGPLIDRMPGDEWQRLANMRLMYGYMFTHPGMNLLFMGGEFGQTTEWHHDKGLDWTVANHPLHKGLQEWVKKLNHYFKHTPALYHHAFDAQGFEWIAQDDHENSVLVYLRKGTAAHKSQIIACNFTPAVHDAYRIGVPEAGEWKEVLNSDAKAFGGSGIDNPYGLVASDVAWQGRTNSIEITLPPLAIIAFELATDEV